MAIAKREDGIYSLNIKGKEVSVFIGDQGAIEMYEEKDPAGTGFFFNSIKELTLFCNYLCDIVENEDKNAKI